MHVVGEASLKEQLAKHPNARSSLARWMTLTRAATWMNFQDVKDSFPTADYIPQSQYCFNIAGNNYRLITTISFELGTVTILNFMTHAEYDKHNLNTR